MRLFSEYIIKNKAIKNRIVMPPMVCPEWSDDNGFVSQKHIDHYEACARGGVGLIIVEACSISKSGRSFGSQLGIWSDEQIPGLKKVVTACHRYGTKVIIQLTHAGLRVHQSIFSVASGPSESDMFSNRTKAMSIEDIESVKNDYVCAALRAMEAGFDGVEFQGAHGLLLEQFILLTLNKRTDEYGGSLQNRLRLLNSIIGTLLCKMDKDFIIGCRIGCSAPTLKASIELAQALEIAGIDVLSISTSGLCGFELQKPELLKARIGLMGEEVSVPDGFDYNWVVYCGAEIKKQVAVPVIIAGEICTPERAEDIIESGLGDFAAIGKDLLVDPEWANKALAQKKISYCLRCSVCSRFMNGDSCTINQ